MEFLKALLMNNHIKNKVKFLKKELQQAKRKLMIFSKKKNRN